MFESSHAIGVFDSGVGGLTVMKQLISTLPNERFIYFGDTARVPYGNKSRETVIRYSIENTIFLLEKNIKLLVIACNTASAFALSQLRKLFKIPIIEVIEAGAKGAVATSRNGRIAILGTKGTIESGAYQNYIHKIAPNAVLFPIACPLFVPLVEEQWLNHPATQLIIEEYLQPLFGQDIDTILLGCTHYPLLRHLIQEKMGNTVSIADSAEMCANQVAALLRELQLNSPIRMGNHQYFVSDDPKKFCSLAEHVFKHTIEDVKLLSEVC